MENWSARKEPLRSDQEDILAKPLHVICILRDPQFQGQTKDKLVTADATKQTEAAVRDRFELWLSAEPTRANDLLDRAIERMEDRKRKRKEKDVARKSATVQSCVQSRQIV